MQRLGQRCFLLLKQHDHTCQDVSLKKKGGGSETRITGPELCLCLCVAHRELAQCLNIFFNELLTLKNHSVQEIPIFPSSLENADPLATVNT